MIAEELKVVIRAETAQAVRELKKTQQESSRTDGSFRRMAGTLVRTAAGFAAAAVSVRALVSTLRESIQLAGVQEQAERGLEAALRATGDTSAESAQMLKDLASELQGVTTFGDEATIAAAGLFTQVSGLSAELTARSLPAVQDFAAAMGMDLQQAASLVGRSIGSTTNALSRYGIQIEEGLEGTERMEAIIGQLDDRFGGFASAVAATSSGAMTQFQNALGDLKEVGGQSILEFFRPAIVSLTTFTQKLTEAWQEAQTLQDVLDADGQASDIEQLADAIAAQEAELERLYRRGTTAALKQAESGEIILQNLRDQRAALAAVARAEAMTRAARSESEQQAASAAERAAAAEQEELARLDRLRVARKARGIYLAQEAEEQRKLAEATAEAEQARARSFEDASTQIRATFAEESAARLASIGQQILAEEALAEKQRMLQEERVQVAQDTTQFLLDASADVLSGLFKNERAAAIVNRVSASFRAAINTAEAATKALTLGPILGPPAAAAVAALGAAQVAAINAQPLPAFEKGGSFITSGPQAIMVGDGQSPRERVTVEPLSGPYRGGGGGVTINISGVIGGREQVADWVAEGIRRGQARGKIRS
jgi:hypothetical protein